VNELFQNLSSEKSMKRASGGRNAIDLVFDTLLDGLNEVSKTPDEKLKDRFNQDLMVRTPQGFKPYSDIWRYEPVDSKYFFGVMMGESLTDKQQEAADVIVGINPFEFTNLDYDQIILMWGKGSGKDSTIAKIFSYQNYKMACMVNPQKYLGLGLDSPVDIVNVASNSNQAKSIFFKYLKSYIKAVKEPKTGYSWFANKNFWYDESRQKVVFMDLREKDGAFKKNSIEFGRNISCHSLTADKFTAEGLTIVLAVMDEVGGMRPDKVFGSSGDRGENMLGQYDSLGTSVRRSTKYGKLLAISYKYGRNCPMSMLVRREKANKKSFVKIYSTYEVRTDKIESELRKQFSRDYETDPEKAKMIYECKEPLTTTNNFFSNIYIIKNFIDVARKFSVNPLKKGVHTVSDISDIDNILEDWFVGNKDYFYTAHADLAKGRVWAGGDACGIGLGHVQEMRVSYDKAWVAYYKKQYGVDLSEQEGKLRQGIVMDLIFQITCTRDQGEVRISDCRKFICDLQNKRNFGMIKVSLDGWGSVETIQEFNRQDITAECNSVDRTKIPYETFKSYAQQGIFKSYYNPILDRECSELLDTPKKIDHPIMSVRRFEEEGFDHGSKELSDCCAGVSQTLTEEIMENGDLIFG
jgi:hypothetical protein